MGRYFLEGIRGMFMKMLKEKIMKYIEPEMEITVFDFVPITQVSVVEGETVTVPGVNVGDVDW